LDVGLAGAILLFGGGQGRFDRLDEEFSVALFLSRHIAAKLLTQPLLFVM
jgi:hypothetical protein